MSDNTSDAFKAAGAAAAGAGVGAAVHATIGGVGVAAFGTAIGVTLGPFVCIGAGAALTGYGLYWAGKQIGRASGGRTEAPEPA